jgi:rSAM/selenodomain-associated transferase 1
MPKSGNALVVMAKAPVAGAVKTRLVPPLSSQEAVEFYRCLLLDLLESFASFEDADLFVAFTPADAASLFHELAPPGFLCFSQRGRDLGERMRSIFEDLFEKGYERVVVSGSDLPVFPSSFLSDAFRALAESFDVVLGPSRDGGYYLIGSTRLVPEIFTGIPWGTGQVIEATRRQLSRTGVEPFLLPVWFDVDTIDDLRAFEKMVSSGVPTRASELLKNLSGLRKASNRL